jgi:Lrp/AsnC ligand binding domain
MGAEENIINEVAKLSDVKEVRGTYGVHDIFVKVKSDSTETLNHTITSKIRRTPGITPMLVIALPFLFQSGTIILDSLRFFISRCQKSHGA